MAIRPVQLIGFQPDLAPDTPGVIVGSSQCLPTDRGVGNGWGIAAASDTASGTCFGGYEHTKIDGTARVFLATATKIYENVAATMTDRSGSAYNAGLTQQWTFASYGNTCLAINKGDRLQTSASGSFADAFADAPKATTVIVAGPSTRPFAILFDYDDGTDTPHGIYWSPDPTLTWATSIATQVGKVSVVDINGKFTAAVAYRDGAIAFKANAMYEGRYVGGSDMWVWNRISSDIGCIGPHAVCSSNDVIYFVDKNGAWQYDGSYPKPMPGAIHQYIANRASPTATNWALNDAQSCVLTWDKNRHVLWLRIADSFLGSIGQHLAFNPRSQLWTNYGAITNGTLNASRLLGPNYAARDSTMQFLALSKTSASSQAATITLNAIGNEYGMVTLRSLRPHWLQGAAVGNTSWASATLTWGESLRNVTDNTAAMSPAPTGRFDFVKTARYVQPTIAVAAANSWELDRFSTDGAPAGQE